MMFKPRNKKITIHIRDKQRRLIIWLGIASQLRTYTVAVLDVVEPVFSSSAPSVPKNGTLVAKSAQNAPSVRDNGTLVAPGRGYHPETRQKRNQGRA